MQTQFALVGITVGIVFLPAPGILAHLFDSSFSFPSELFESLRGIRIAGCDISGTAVSDNIGDFYS